MSAEPVASPAPPPSPAFGLRLRPRWGYGSLAVQAMQRGIAYRSSSLISAATSLLIVFLQLALWESVFDRVPQVGPFDRQEMRAYVVLAFAINALLPGRVEFQLYGMVRDGSVAMELTRPVDYLLMQFAQAVGSAVIELLTKGALALLLGALLVDASVLPSAPVALACLLSIAMGFVLKFLLCYLTALLCFWVLHVNGLLWMRSAITNILSGTAVPLELLPSWLATVAHPLPFRFMVYVPLMVFLGKLQGPALAAALVAQAGWVVLMVAAARLFWRASLKRLVIQGG